ncbi:hypothetical protein K7432_003031 [Basidiobolus ranarum]|uniref:Uncharacterized protein n=1 Tax=Basidiobolus ranarum TaxID=34480 RepID=A0ABR2W783_9FUNG
MIRTPGTLHRLGKVIFGEGRYEIIVLHSIFSPLRGFINFLTFFYLSWFAQLKGDLRDIPSGNNTDFTGGTFIENMELDIDSSLLIYPDTTWISELMDSDSELLPAPNTKK